MIHVIWAAAVAILGFIIAFDYRNLGMRAYDLACAFTPGGPPGPSFSPDRFRILWGILGLGSSAAVGVYVYNWLNGY
ncbi:hypothetical protein [Streptomyces sp. NPDC051569]|uniref:hypothetical protein n=1 Tax=Streptomyces sp. NPDC051569 TaxID=3365661 RepID=UPI0037A67D58